MPLRVQEYVRPDGTSPFRQWFDRLDATAAAKVTTALLRLAAGNTSRVKWFSGIGECVIDWGPGYRVYLAHDGPALVVLFTGGTKRRQEAHITRALALHDEYKARKRRSLGRAGARRKPGDRQRR